MPRTAFLKPSHKAIKRYYQSLDEYRAHKVKHEGALETAFQRLLEAVGHTVGWRMTPKEKLRVGNSNIFPDGTLRDFYNARCGFCEAKDTDDDNRSGNREENRPGNTVAVHPVWN